jgi:hypothetical protein
MPIANPTSTFVLNFCTIVSWTLSPAEMNKNQVPDHTWWQMAGYLSSIWARVIFSIS